MKIVYMFLIALILPQNLFSQDIKPDNAKKYVSWALMQLIPSPTLFQDSDGKDARMQFGFKWQITPVNISFNPNKYVTPVQFFFINPVRRFTGSAEIFIQPELAISSFKYSNIGVFGLSAGSRILLPLREKGENLSVSLGGKYTYRKNYAEDNNSFYGIEAGVYVFGGIIGLQYTQNFNTNTNYNISLYIKYF